MNRYSFLYVYTALLVLVLSSISSVTYAQYCTPAVSDCSSYGDYIESFSTSGAITNITNNSSGCATNGYAYYPSLSISANQGSAFNLSITMGTYPVDEYFTIWIDWNQDDDFNDVDEENYTYGPTTMSYEVALGSITVPYTATPGTTRMRLMCSFTGLGTPCGVVGVFGETEDYDFEVLPGSCDAPTNISPTIGINSADFTWDAMTNALGYEYVIDQLPTDPTTAGTLTTATSLNVWPLPSSTTYYLHLRTKCAATFFSDWVTIDFTTLFNPCPQPSGIVFTPLSITQANFTWTAVPGSAGYFYKISTSDSLPITNGTSNISNTVNVGGLLSGVQYYFFVRNECTPSGMSDWTMQPFIIFPCTISPGILVSNTTDTSTDFAWAGIAAANYYEYQVDFNYIPPSGGGSGFSTTSVTNAHVEGLLPLTQYYIHVRARCYTNDSSAWSLDSVKTKRGCTQPVVTVKDRNTNNPSVKWDIVVYSTGFEYVLSKDINPPLSGTKTTNRSLPAFALPADGQNYYFHVRTDCGQIGLSKWTTELLRTGGVGVPDVGNEKHILEVYPNPVNDILVIKVTDGEEGLIHLTDMMGKLLQTVTLKSQSTNIDVSILPAGFYMLKYFNHSYTEVIKLVVE